MLTDHAIREILTEQKHLLKPPPQEVEREALPEAVALSKLKHVVVITGPRRAGKSVFLSQIANKLYKNENLYYINFDDERLITLKVQHMNRVLENLRFLFGESKVIFMDEIQNLEKWELFVARLFNQGFKIYITGSNANLLSSELATHLTGRHLDIELLPFSFREYLKYHGIDPEQIFKEKKHYTMETRTTMTKHLENYMETGGFPEMVISGEPKILKTLFNDIITKDIIGRYSVKEVRTLKEIATFLLSNIAGEISYNKIKNTYNLGSVHTVKNYINYMEAAYLVFEVSRFSYSLKNSQVRTKKIYAVDTGMAKHVGVHHLADAGKLFENLIFLELKRRKCQVYHFKDPSSKKETDFVIKKSNGELEAVQVAYEIESEDTFSREIYGLMKAMKTFGLKRGIIITKNHEEALKIKGFEIYFVPAWKWLPSTAAFEEVMNL